MEKGNKNDKTDMSQKRERKLHEFTDYRLARMKEREAHRQIPAAK